MFEDALEMAYDTEELMLEYHTGNISDAEAFELGLIDEQGFEYPFRGRAKLTCRCCGISGLRWQQLNGKWLLHEGSTLHDCKVNPYKPS